MPVQKISVSLSDAVLRILDSRSDNRSGELEKIVRTYYAIIETGNVLAEKTLANTDEKFSAIRCLAAAGVSGPASAVVAFSSEFSDIVSLGGKLIGLDEIQRKNLSSRSKKLDYVSRVALSESAGRVLQEITNENSPN